MQRSESPVPSTSRQRSVSSRYLGTPSKKRKARDEKILRISQMSNKEIIRSVDSDQVFSDESSDTDFGSEEEDAEETVTLGRIPTPVPTGIVTVTPTVPTPSSLSPTPLLTWSEGECLPASFSFSGTQALLTVPIGSNPIDYFNLFFSDEFFQLVTENTNKYVENDFLNKTCEVIPQRITNWKELTREELEVFLGLLFHMGTVRTNRMRDYWNRDEKFDFKFFYQRMTRDRFLSILQNLHFSANPDLGDPIPTDPLFKIRPLLDFFHSVSEKTYTPAKNLCIDESMVLWRGRLRFRTYVKGKQHKFGLKLYMLTEPNGYVLRFIVYTGKDDAELGGQEHASKVVHKLMEGKFGVGYSLFMDNYYNDVNLAQELLNNRCYCTGTLRTDRKGNPPEVVRAKLKKGETICMCTNTGINVMKWKDVRDVLMISTEFGNQVVDVTTKKGNHVKKPQSVAKYNTHMRGINRVDQLMAYYPCDHKTLKWYRRLGIHVIQVMLINSYILYKKFNQGNMTLHTYRLSIIDALAKETTRRNLSVLRRPSIISIDSHFPKYCEKRNNRRVQKRCRQCSKKNKKSVVITYCPDCPDEPGLCLEDCFQEYHRQLE